MAMRSSFESVLKHKNLAHLDKAGAADPRPPRRVAFALREHFSLMAFTGAVDALVTANLMSSTPLFEVRVVGDASERVVSDLGIAISADCRLAELAEKQLDLLVVCGGFRARLEADPLLRGKLRGAASTGAALGGLWNGAFFLAEAGLLDDYQCAFHPDGRAIMAELFPRVRLSNQAYVLDRQRISCAGANSSLGMMLEVVRQRGGDPLVSAVEEVLSCDKRREVMDVSVVAVDQDPTLPQALKSALELMHNNIEEPLAVDELAECVGMSRRQLERLFGRHVHATPSRYYLELRLTRARQLLQQTNKPMAEIAVACGFVSISHFRRCFSECFEIAPGRFRERVRGTSRPSAD